MKVWDYPYQIYKTALNAELEVAYIDEGKGSKTLLFIHGLGSNLKCWQKNIKKLSKYFRCIAIDLPGYGKSSKNKYPYDMTFFSQTVSRFIEVLQLENVILIGHSMGAQIATHVVLNNKALIEKLVLIAPAGFETFSAEEKKWFEAIYQPGILKGLSKGRIIKNFELNFFEMPDDARFMIEDRMLMRASKEYDHFCEMVPKCVMGMLKEPIFYKLEKIILPCLILYGENDQLIPNQLIHPRLRICDVAKAGHQQIQNSQLIMIPQAGHFLQWERSSLLNQYIKSFLLDT